MPNRRKFLSTVGLSTIGTASLANPLLLLHQDFDKDLKITQIKTYLLKRAVLVKVETNAGIDGWGECSSNSPEPVVSIIHTRFKEFLIGKDPFNSNYIWDMLFWDNHDYGPSGYLPYALAGIDLALWDIKGKALGQPVHRLIGGKYRSEIVAYCGIPLRGGTVPVEKAIERAQKVVELGFKTVKLRMQIREYNLDPIPDPTLKYYEAIRNSLPEEVDLFVDPNEGYTAARAIQVGLELEKMGMKYYESPVPRENNRDLASIVEEMTIPVMAGEKCYTRWEFRDLITEGNPDILNPDLIKAGGITEVAKIATLAQTYFKRIVPHNTKPTLGTAAALHLMASISNVGPFIEFVELDTYQEVLSCINNPLTLSGGKLKVPEGPGLGLEVDEKRVRSLNKD